MRPESPASPAPFPMQAADQCVKCGLCLPHCPTYGVTLDEAESPRGRIALMQGLASGALAASPALQGHLDSVEVPVRSVEPQVPTTLQLLPMYSQE